MTPEQRRRRRPPQGEQRRRPPQEYDRRRPSGEAPRRRRPPQEEDRRYGAWEEEPRRRRRPVDDDYGYHSGNPAKSGARKRNPEDYDHPDGGKRGKQGRKKDLLGLILAGMQGFVSVVFLMMVHTLGMIPAKYISILAVVLLMLFAITMATQLFGRKKRIGGKIFSIFMMLVLLLATYYVTKANGAIGKITGGSYKVDNMVVAVLAGDSAESIEDAASYLFGVQYGMGGDDVRKAEQDINAKIGGTIQTKEYKDLREQAQALHDGQVQAIIYNEGYTGILQEAFENYSQNVKIIYNHSIKKELDDTASKIEVQEQTFSVFISGIDVYGPIETNSRSDVNIIATVNPKTHQILLTSTPRDYYVELPGVSGGQKDKLTHAGIYGVDTSMNTLGQLYDTEVQFYARVNFTSLIDIVDELGGIDVNSEVAFTTSPESDLVMDVAEGVNHFNGQQALAFSRERLNLEGGDNQRGKNQQAVITAIIKKVISPALLVNANGIINSLSGNVETNMSQEQIQNLVKSQLNKGGAWNIYSVSAEGIGDEQYCYSYGGGPLYVMQPDSISVDRIRALMDSVENGEVLEGSDVAQ